MSGRVSKHSKNHVFQVPEDGMCTGCGVCASVCPHDCIKMELDNEKGVHQSVMNLDACTDCGMCVTSCPPISWSNKPKTTKHDFLVGDYEKFFAIHANENDTRLNGASGGFITEFLIYLLEKNLIDGAIVSRRISDAPFKGEPFIAKTAEEIKNARTSIYAPVEISKVVDFLIELTQPTLKLAMVGLPCHIEGISKAATMYANVRRMLKYKITLVCGQSPSALAYEYIFKKLKIDPDQVHQLKNRGGGWPGNVIVTKKNGEEITYPYTSKYSMGMVLSSPIFTPSACQNCVDAVGFEGDITVSDAWLPKFKSDKIGRNLVMVKSGRMLDIITEMEEEKRITVEEASLDEFIEANENVINKTINNHLIHKNSGITNERYHRQLIKPVKVGIIRRIFIYVFSLHVRLIHRLGVRRILRVLNDKVLFYFKAVNLLKKYFLSGKLQYKSDGLILDLDVKELLWATEDTLLIELENKNESIAYCFKPGQFLTLVVEVDGKEHQRSYSIASAPFTNSILLAIKRIEGGVVSNHLLDNVKVGEVIKTIAPTGLFYLPDGYKHEAIVFIAAGSGITPLYSMMNEVLYNSKKSVVLIYQNKSVKTTIFKSELDTLKTKFGKRLTIENIYSQEENPQNGHSGRLDGDLLQKILEDLNSFVKLKNTHFYICGPQNLMDSLSNRLEMIGAANVFTEAFYEFEDREKKQQLIEDFKLEDQQVKLIDYVNEDWVIKVNAGESILKAGLEQDADLSYSCLTGQCQACKAKVISGEVHMKVSEGLTENDIDQNYILTCQSFPLTNDVSLEI